MDEIQIPLEAVRQDHRHGWAPALRQALLIHQQTANTTEEVLVKVQVLQATFEQMRAELEVLAGERSPQALMTHALQTTLVALQKQSDVLIQEQRGGLEKQLQAHLAQTDKVTRMLHDRSHHDFELKVKQSAEPLRTYLTQQIEALTQVVDGLVKQTKGLDQQRAQLVERERRLVAVLEDNWFGRLTWLVAGRYVSRRVGPAAGPVRNASPQARAIDQSATSKGHPPLSQARK